MSDTGSPTKLKSEKAMSPTTSITRAPCTMRRRTKAIIPRPPFAGTSLDLDPLHRELVVRAVHHGHVRAHRPGDHLEMQRDVAHLGLVDRARLARVGRALRGADPGLQLFYRLVHLAAGVLAEVVVAVRALLHARAHQA